MSDGGVRLPSTPLRPRKPDTTTTAVVVAALAVCSAVALAQQPQAPGGGGRGRIGGADARGGDGGPSLLRSSVVLDDQNGEFALY